jgi:hypothetical protein
LPILTYERIYRYLPRLKLTPRCDDSAPKKDLSPRVLRSLLAGYQIRQKTAFAAKKHNLTYFRWMSTLHSSVSLLDF